MRWAPLAAALLCAPAFAGDEGVRVYYRPENLWRTPFGSFVGSVEGGKLVLVYDFFDEIRGSARYSSCPPDAGDPAKAPPCAAFQDAVGESLGLWARATGRLVLRRRASPSEPVNIWIAWTDGFAEPQPVARALDNGRDAAQPDKTNADQGFGGFERVAYPNEKKTSAALLFNAKYCWFLDDESPCPAPVVLPNGKTISKNRPARTVSLHEAGHVLGFGHFTVSSIMGQAGGSERYELTVLDRDAARRLYERVGR